MVTSEQTEAMQEHAESYALTHHLSDDTKVTLSRFTLSVALIQETPADELLAKIKNSTQFQREHTLPEESREDEPLTGLLGRRYTRERVDHFEDNFLFRCVRHFAKQQDFQSAKTFMHEITNQNLQLSALRHCVQEAQTQEDLALLKDENHQNEKGADMIFAQELYFTHQPEKRTLALEFLTDGFMLQIAETWLKNGYETSITEGQTIAHEIGTAINQRPELRQFESTIAKIQLEYGDTEGFKTHYNYLKRTNATAWMYLLLARQCKQWISMHGNET